MQIAEPMTMATDYVMGAVALALAIRVFRQGESEGQMAMRLWATALVMTAVAALVGGSYHGFIEMLPPRVATWMWTLTLAATGFGSAALLAAAAVAGTGGVFRRVLVWIVIVKLACYLFWISSHSDFLIVIVDYSSALVGVVLLAWLTRPSGLTNAAGWITAGVGVSVVAALIQVLRIAPHPQFNHNDLFHVVQTGALYLLYRGGLLMRDAR
ncbi:MAG: hypothetical protein NT151_08975 [Acidobacteria bacterium]|nr:hypothetical protein [Acidobacteriota bacterium]